VANLIVHGLRSFYQQGLYDFYDVSAYHFGPDRVVPFGQPRPSFSAAPSGASDIPSLMPSPLAIRLSVSTVGLTCLPVSSLLIAPLSTPQRSESWASVNPCRSRSALIAAAMRPNFPEHAGKDTLVFAGGSELSGPGLSA